MDHYPYPSEPLYPPVRIPYLPFTYLKGRDGDATAGFDTFPARNGWKKIALLEGELDYAATSPQSACAFLQAWLFFGAVSTVLELEPQCEARFVMKDERGPYISTKCLPDLIRAWTDKVVTYPSQKAEKVIETAMYCLDECSVISIASTQDQPGFRLEKHCPEVQLSIMALGEQLQVALRQVQIRLGTNRSRIGNYAANKLGHDSFLGKAAMKVAQGKSWRQSYLQSKWRNPYTTNVGVVNLGDLGAEFKEIFDVLMIRPEDKEVPAKIGPWQWGTSVILEDRMIKAGWCRYEVARLNDMLSPWAIHYASALVRPSVYDHSECKELHCTAHTIDESNYETQHTTEGCTCEFVGLPLDEVKSALAAGDYPLFRIKRDSDSAKFSLSAKGKKKIGTVDSFWAISHVWSHGLGNAKHNALPTCQIQRLFDIVGRYEGEDYTDTWLWMDTICVPLDPELRRTAVGMMGKIYFEDRGTIVLDKELMMTLSKDKPGEERLLRIFCSSWMQRLWTMQEGATDDTAVAFEDGQNHLLSLLRQHQLKHPLSPIAKGGNAYDAVAQMFACRENSKNWPYRDTLRDRVPDEYGKWLQGRDNGDFQVMRIWNGIRWRQATKDGDAAIILAALLYGKTSGLWIDGAEDTKSFDTILHAKPEERWATLFRTRRTWPQGLCFVKCKTIPEKGLRWAPNEVGTYGRDITDPLPGKVTPRGLIIERPGYMFINLTKRLDLEFEFYDGHMHQWYFVTPMHKDDKSSWPEPDGFYVLILSRREAGYAEVPAIIAKIELLTGSDISDKVIYAEFACKVYVSKVFDERKNDIHAELGPDLDMTNMSQYAKTQRYEEGKTWCIG